MSEAPNFEEFKRYVILLSLNPGRQLERDLIREHVAHLRELDRNGQLVMCGPFLDYKGGMVIIQAASLEEAREIAERDPFVKSGAENYELRTWAISCEENQHLGAG
ncbi:MULTISPECIES: YciI family protein [Paenibacillus]|uniref:YciI family protein n=1 Tax=Paenibacillus TaxID=44249 RepID=UPI0009E7EDCA|nr:MULTISPECIES: YciI family protein [Paenibacillus]MDU4698270.1 YciI family protein [Paenibacillus sp.]